MATRTDTIDTLRNPSFVIGLGGTGVKTVRFMRLLARRRKDAELERMISACELSFYGIDTDRSAFKDRSVSARVVLDANDGLTDNRSPITLPQIDMFSRIHTRAISRAIKVVNREIARQVKGDVATDPSFKPEHAAILDWFPRPEIDDPNGVGLGYDKTSGAGQWRFIGRAGLFLQVRKIFRDLQVLADKVVAAAIERDTPADAYICCSLAGGTGSGMFWDVAFLLRMINPAIRIHGCFMLPDAYEAVDSAGRIRQNTYAALKELAHYKNWRHGREIVVPYPLGHGHTEFRGTPQDEPIFHLVYLFEGAKPSGCWTNSEKIDLSCKHMAESILSSMRSDVSAVIATGANNETGDADFPIEAKESGFVFSTMAAVEFPIEAPDQVQRQLARWYIDRRRRAERSQAASATSVDLPDILAEPDGGESLIGKWLSRVRKTRRPSSEIIDTMIARAKAGVAALDALSAEEAPKRAEIPERLHRIVYDCLPKRLSDTFQVIIGAPRESDSEAAAAKLSTRIAPEDLIGSDVSQARQTLEEYCDALEARIDDDMLKAGPEAEALLDPPPRETLLSAQKDSGVGLESRLEITAHTEELVSVAFLLRDLRETIHYDRDGEIALAATGRTRDALVRVIEGLEQIDLGVHLPNHAFEAMHLDAAFDAHVQRCADLRDRLKIALDAQRRVGETRGQVHAMLIEGLREVHVDAQQLERILRRSFAAFEEPEAGQDAMRTAADGLVLTALAMVETEGDTLEGLPRTAEPWRIALDAAVEDMSRNGSFRLEAIGAMLDRLVTQPDWDTPNIGEAARYRRRLDLVLACLTRYLLGQSAALIEQLGGRDGIEKKLATCRNAVFEMGPVEHGPEKTNLVLIPPAGGIEGAEGRQRRDDLLDMLEKQARNIFEGNPSVEMGDGATVPLIFYQALFRAPQEIRSLESLYRAYMSEGIDRRAYFHFEHAARNAPELQVEFEQRQIVDCGNPGCSEDIAALDRADVMCPHCNRPILNRCGNRNCIADDLVARYERYDGSAGTPRKCDACRQDLKTYWWRCKRHTKEPIPMACEVCETCLTDFRSGNLGIDEIQHRPDRAGLHCAGCVDLSQTGDHPIQIVEPGLNEFLRKGVRKDRLAEFRKLLERSNARRRGSEHHDGHICPSVHGPQHHLFPTCPVDAHDPERVHHLFLTEFGFVCPVHVKKTFVECGHCHYPIDEKDPSLVETGTTECPRCSRVMTHCDFCSVGTARLYEAKPDADGRQRCPNCTNFMRIDEDVPLTFLRTGAKRPGFCTNVYGCEAGRNLWSTSAIMDTKGATGGPRRYCAVCPTEKGRSGWRLKAFHYASKYAEQCPACRFVLGVKREDEGYARPDTIPALRRALKADGYHTAGNASFVYCPVCGCQHKASYLAIGLGDSSPPKTPTSTKQIKMPEGFSESPVSFDYETVPGGTHSDSEPLNALEILRVLRDETDDEDAHAELLHRGFFDDENKRFAEMKQQIFEMFAAAAERKLLLMNRLKQIDEINADSSGH